MHLYVLKYLVDLCEPYIDRSDESYMPDGEFKPNIKNSVMFVYQWWLQCAVILVNYSGRPFMQSMSENKKLKYLPILTQITLPMKWKSQQKHLKIQVKAKAKTHLTVNDHFI